MTRPDLPPLTTLLPFEATVRHASMTRAARELHVTHGAVSRQVRNLERALGTELFERGPRALRPTPQARRLAAAVRDALDLVEEAAREISGGRERGGGPLALSCEPTLLMRWLIPRLPDLTAGHPGLTVHLSAGGGPVDFAREPVDAAVRRDDFPVPEGVSRVPLFEEWIGPVCRPDLVERLRAGEPVTLLHTGTRPAAWADWHRLTGETSTVRGEQTFEHFYLALQAAVAGVGVAVGPYALVHDDLVRGQLAAPYGFVPDGTGYGLLTPRPPERDPRLATLLGWLREQAADLNPPARPVS
ncbi:LysR family transcriptional regulator [Streptomyces sp. SKN60]|uniref:LysR substrate-binding domain-containing protein n=1 Tax=Streptomyces sp. SKN60 TaxID=2855506 RepID=UPI0022465C35|nr:LysR substrate-binding domain-containing protein [Streptomyces sp. SKN60]MCX2181833.1 LysR family transcriptional regulator [Streptomyces sp. SKN60]